MREDRYSTTDPFNETDPNEINQRRAILLRLLRGRWHWAILLAVLLSVVGGYLGFNSQPNKYEAYSSVRILKDYNSESPVAVADISLYEIYLNYVKSEIDRMRSVEVAEIAMDQPEWEAAVANRPAHLPEITPENFADNISVREPGKDEDTLYVSFVNQHPETAKAGLNTLLYAYGEMRKQVEVDNVGESLDVLEVRKKQHEDAIDAKNVEIEDELAGDSIDTIESRYRARVDDLNMLEREYKKLEIELKPFEKSKDGEQPSEAERRKQLAELLKQDETMQGYLAEKKRLDDLYYLKTVIQERGETMPDVMAVKNQQRLVMRQIEDYEIQWYKNAGPGENAQPAALAELMKYKEVLVAAIAQVNAEIQDLGPRVRKIQKLVKDRSEQIAKLDETKGKIQNFVDTKDLRNKSKDNLSRVKIGPPKATPTSPYNTGKRRQMAGVGAIGGFFMGFGLVMAVGLFDRRMRHVTDATADMPETPVLGVLPTLPAKINDPEDAETAAQCVHHIRTLMQIGGSNRVFAITSPSAGSGKSSLATALGMSFATSGARTLLIDCDLVGAGLTRRMGTVVHEPLETVIRRNQLLGEADLSSALTKATATQTPLAQVLLEELMMTQDKVDAALRLQRDTSLGLLDACGPGRLRPPVLKANDDDLFIMIDDPGTANTAYPMETNSSMSMIESSEHNRLRACVAQTEIENLSILPVGKARPADASRLSPAAMRELVRQAREAFDIVLIDTGPVLGSIEASIAAAEADSTVMIVSRGDQKAIATRSLEKLRSVRANIAGVVFNHALDSDLAHTSYASIISQERRPDRNVRKRRLDSARSARLGPLGSAVASCTDEDSQSNQGDALSKLNGEHNGQGHE